MHQELTKYGRSCIANNQFPTKSHFELEYKKLYWTYLLVPEVCVSFLNTCIDLPENAPYADDRSVQWQDAMEYAQCEAVVKEYGPFVEAMKKRGIDDMDLVMVDPWYWPPTLCQVDI